MRRKEKISLSSIARDLGFVGFQCSDVRVFYGFLGVTLPTPTVREASGYSPLLSLGVLGGTASEAR